MHVVRGKEKRRAQVSILLWFHQMNQKARRFFG